MYFFILLILLLRFELIFTTPLNDEDVTKRAADEETFLTEEDFKRAKQLPTSRLEGGPDSTKMFNRNLFEGDIANRGLTPENVQTFVDGTSSTHLPGIMRNAIRDRYMLWPNGRVPYSISTQFDEFERATIARAFDEYAQKTCIRFVPRDNSDINYVYFQKVDGCFSSVGRVGGKQVVSLDNGCVYFGTVLHELMHAVGFFHEQSRNDRDEYIRILWENIQEGLQDQFEKYSLAIIDHLGTKYDYGSVMHYPRNAFSRNGLPTIETMQEGVVIGQRRQFSSNDIYKINKLYSCADVLIAPTTQQTEAPPTTARTEPPIVLPVFTAEPPEITLPEIFTIEPTEITTPEIPGPETISGKCKDEWNSCHLLAMFGQCDFGMTADIMATNCAKTCDKCKSETCRDSRSWCDDWAQSGLCNDWMYIEYMLENCPKSCSFC